MEDHLINTKSSVLEHIQKLFEEMEHEIAVSHQEKYALLEDVLGNATDVDELRVAFDQWYHDHADDVGFDEAAHELWDAALIVDEDDDEYIEEDEEEDEDEEGDKGVE